MATSCIFRPHRTGDHDAIVRLRWALKQGDHRQPTGSDFKQFRNIYAAHLADVDLIGDTTHWLAETGGAIIGLMTVRVVRKEPSPGRAPGKWGYLTNCIVEAAHRNRGIGTGLLSVAIDGARTAGLELLIVWPSQQSYPFYRRAGFTGHSDPLELDL